MCNMYVQVHACVKDMQSEKGAIVSLYVCSAVCQCVCM